MNIIMIISITTITNTFRITSAGKARSIIVFRLLL